MNGARLHHFPEIQRDLLTAIATSPDTAQLFEDLSQPPEIPPHLATKRGNLRKASAT